MKNIILIVFFLFIKHQHIIAQSNVLVVWGDSLKIINEQIVTGNIDLYSSNTYSYLDFKNRTFNQFAPSLELERRVLIYFGNSFNKNFTFPYNPLDFYGDFKYHKDSLYILTEYSDTNCTAYIDPLPDGKWLCGILDNNGSLKIICEKNVKNNLLDGICQGWENNGIYGGKEHFRSGFLDSMTSYYECGNIKHHATYLNKCNKEKESWSYYDSGELLSFYNYDIKKKMYFYKSGLLSRAMIFGKFGLPDGESREYNENGYLTRILYYKAGVLINKREIK